MATVHEKISRPGPPVGSLIFLTAFHLITAICRVGAILVLIGAITPMAKSRFVKPATRRSISHGLALICSGLAVGWMIGLSVSPVIQGVITALISVIVGVVGVVAGIEGLRDRVSGEGDETDGVESPPPKRRRSESLDVSPWPVACLVAALAVGASLGAMARVGDWLAPDPSLLAARWTKTGLTEAERVRRLFEHSFPPPGKAAGEDKDKDLHRTSAMPTPMGLYLFAEKRTALCKKLVGEEDPQAIESVLQQEVNEDIERLVKLCNGDPKCLKALKNVLCDELR
jgi:hypothetical protein